MGQNGRSKCSLGFLVFSVVELTFTCMQVEALNVNLRQNFATLTKCRFGLNDARSQHSDQKTQILWNATG